MLKLLTCAAIQEVDKNLARATSAAVSRQSGNANNFQPTGQYFGQSLPGQRSAPLNQFNLDANQGLAAGFSTPGNNFGSTFGSSMGSWPPPPPPSLPPHATSIPVEHHDANYNKAYMHQPNSAPKHPSQDRYAPDPSPSMPPLKRKNSRGSIESLSEEVSDLLVCL